MTLCQYLASIILLLYIGFFLHLSVKKVIQSNQSRFYDIFQICRSWPRRGKGDYGGDSEVDIRFFAKLAK